jgi:hypothetical protein
MIVYEWNPTSNATARPYWMKVKEPNRPNSFNFVICCQYGDWSGFRSLQECLSQTMSVRPAGFFWIEER